MKCIIRPTYEEMSQVTAQILLGTIYQDKRINMSITAGATPVGVYNIVAEVIRKNPDDFRHVHYYSFDNMTLDNDKDGVTGRDLRKQFFIPANIAEENIHLIDEFNHKIFMNEIQDRGGLDIMLIGLGADGHFCGNMPGLTVFHQESYTVQFLKYFENHPEISNMFGESKIPEFAVTMGAAALMKTKRLILIVNGKSKADAVKKLMKSPVDPIFPSSILKLHPNFCVILDEQAASKL